jgi:hypothetical protein
MRRLRTVCWMGAFLGMLHVSIRARSQGGETNTQTPSSVPAQPPASAAPPVCTENFIRVDAVMESPKLAERAALFRSGRPGLAIQVEVAA